MLDNKLTFKQHSWRASCIAGPVECRGHTCRQPSASFDSFVIARLLSFIFSGNNPVVVENQNTSSDITIHGGGTGSLDVYHDTWQVSGACGLHFVILPITRGMEDARMKMGTRHKGLISRRAFDANEARDH